MLICFLASILAGVLSFFGISVLFIKIIKNNLVITVGISLLILLFDILCIYLLTNFFDDILIYGAIPFVAAFFFPSFLFAFSNFIRKFIRKLIKKQFKLSEVIIVMLYVFSFGGACISIIGGMAIEKVLSYFILVPINGIFFGGLIGTGLQKISFKKKKHLVP
jgi:hypothetical protein